MRANFVEYVYVNVLARSDEYAIISSKTKFDDDATGVNTMTYLLLIMKSEGRRLSSKDEYERNIDELRKGLQKCC